jgi:hypothetical protein
MDQRTVCSKVLLVIFIPVFSSCIPDFPQPPASANIGCRTSADCPTGWTCIEATGKCVEAEKVKDPPSLTGTPSIAPAILKSGATAVISFTSNRELSETPVVVVKISGVSRIVSFGTKDGTKYTFNYTAAGDETQGVENPVTVVMTDKFGSRSGELPLGTIKFDFVTPRMTDAVVTGSPATTGKTVAVEFNVSKALKNDPAVAFDDVVGARHALPMSGGPDVGAGSPRPEMSSPKGAGTAPLQFVKDPSSTGLHYKYTYVSAGTETQDVDLPIVVDIEDEAGNAATGLEAGKARFDFGKPSIVTESTCAPRLMSIVFPRKTTAVIPLLVDVA